MEYDSPLREVSKDRPGRMRRGSEPEVLSRQPVVAAAPAAAKEGPAAAPPASSREHELAVEVQPAEPKGMGVFALEPCDKGRFICNYEGQPLTAEELEEREARPPEDWSGDYVFEVGYGGLCARHAGARTSDSRLLPHGRLLLLTGSCDAAGIDAEHSAHVSRFINHDAPWCASCEVEEAHDPDAQRPVVRIVARRAIAAGDEITFDYGNDFWRAKKRANVEPVVSATDQPTLRAWLQNEVDAWSRAAGIAP